MKIVLEELGSSARLIQWDASDAGLKLAVVSSQRFSGWIFFSHDAPLEL